MWFRIPGFLQTHKWCRQDTCIHKLLALLAHLRCQCYCNAGLLRAVAPCYRYYSGATCTVAVAPLILVEKNGDGSAASFSLVCWRYALPLLSSRQFKFWVSIIVLELEVECWLLSNDIVLIRCLLDFNLYPRNCFWWFFNSYYNY